MVFPPEKLNDSEAAFFYRTILRIVNASNPGDSQLVGERKEIASTNLLQIV